jgi:hypothetical protein
MELNVYKYFIFLLIFIIIGISYLFYPFILEFENNIQSIYIIIIILMLLNLISIYWTLANYEKHSFNIGSKGEEGDRGLPGLGGDPEVCNICEKPPDSSKTPETTIPQTTPVLLDLIIISEKSEEETDKLSKKKEKEGFKILRKNLTLSTSRQFDTLMGKFGASSDSKITDLKVELLSQNCDEDIETSGDVKICIEKNKERNGITEDKIIISSTKPENEKLIPLNENLETITPVYLYIKK